MNDFLSNLAQVLGVKYVDTWKHGSLNHEEVIAAIKRLNGCSKQIAKQILNALLPYTTDFGCNGMFYGAIAQNSGALARGNNLGIANTCFIDLHTPANNVWEIASVSDELGVVVCNGFVVAVIGVAPAGMGIRDFVDSSLTTITPQFYSFMGFMFFLAQSDEAKVDLSIGLVDSSGADIEWFEFDTVQTEYLAAKSLFQSGGIFNSLYLRAAMYGHRQIDGILYENNDMLAEALIKLVDTEASGVVDVTAPEIENAGESDPTQDGAGSAVAEDGADGIHDIDETPSEEASTDFDFDELTDGESAGFESNTDLLGEAGESGLENADSFSEDEFDTAFGLTGETTIDVGANEEAEEGTVGSETNAEIDEYTADTFESDEAVSDAFNGDLDTFDDIPDNTGEFGDFGDAGIDNVQEPILLGRKSLETVLRRAIGDSDELMRKIIGEQNVLDLTGATSVGVAEICQIMSDEFYTDDVIASFTIFANDYIENGEIRCDEAIKAIASAIWGNNATHARPRNLNHAAALLARHYDVLCFGAYNSDEVANTLSALGYSEELCIYVKELMYEEKYGGIHGALIDISDNVG